MKSICDYDFVCEFIGIEFSALLAYDNQNYFDFSLNGLATIEFYANANLMSIKILQKTISQSN